MRMIPKNTKVKVEFFKNISIADTILFILVLLIIFLLFLSNIPYKYTIMLIFVALAVSSFFKMDDVRVYKLIINGFIYLAVRKKYSKKVIGTGHVSNIIPFIGVHDNVIDYKDYFGAVIEIDPVEFRLLSERKQNDLIDNCFANVIKSLSGDQKASLTKVDRPIVLDEYIRRELDKYDALISEYERGELSDEELEPRLAVLENRMAILEKLNTDLPVYKGCYYFTVFDNNIEAVRDLAEYAKITLERGGMVSKVLNTKELAVFLKYTYSHDFDEREVESLAQSEIYDWIIPSKVELKANKIIVDNIESFNMMVIDYPLNVLNAWGYQLFNTMDTKVTMNITPVEKRSGIKRIDRAINEILYKDQRSAKASSIISNETHLETLSNLLASLQNDNETLVEVNIVVTAYNYKRAKDMAGVINEKAGSKKTGDENNEAMQRYMANANSIKKKVRRLLAEDGFKTNDLFGRQMQGFISGEISKAEMVTEYTRGIHSSSVAAVFPFVVNCVMDIGGILLGESTFYPVILDFFKRDSARVNSNVVILGKSGSGKSYSAKSILTNLACENTKIFVLDPENEYDLLTRNLGGKWIDVGTSIDGRLNPFHVVTSLEDDEGSQAGISFSVHLQFMEEFYRQILQGINSDSLELLNSLTVEMYARKGITYQTNLSGFKPEQFPVFDDLFNLIQEKLETTTDAYMLSNLRVVNNYVNKFAAGGRNSNLWNGPASIETDENFIVFNFQTLLANKNNIIANAQMLLVLKWLDNEIIKNRDYNIKYNSNRKIIVVIDEAHVFIDPKYPIALDFMHQLAKRIRKYNGMQIIITQNVKDFVGSEELARKSTAIINACQYSFIFSLSPNDMHDLTKLYEKAGEINEVEQEDIVNNGRGEAFVITSPLSRTNIKIVTPKAVENTFGH